VTLVRYDVVETMHNLHLKLPHVPCLKLANYQLDKHERHSVKPGAAPAKRMRPPLLTSSSLHRSLTCCGLLLGKRCAILSALQHQPNSVSALASKPDPLLQGCSEQQLKVLQGVRAEVHLSGNAQNSASAASRTLSSSPLQSGTCLK
jgi:hypothetical protein